MATSFNTDQGGFTGCDFLQVLAVADGNEPVARTMQDIDRTAHVPQPFIGAQVIPQHKAHGQDGQEALHHFPETIIRGIQDQVAGGIIGSQFGGKTTAHAAAVNDQMVFGIGLFQGVVYELHIGQHLFFRALAGTLAEAPVIDQHHIIIEPVKIAGIFGPTLDAAGIAVKVEDQSFRVRPVKMQAIDAHTGFGVKKKFGKRGIVTEFKIGL